MAEPSGVSAAYSESRAAGGIPRLLHKAPVDPHSHKHQGGSWPHKGVRGKPNFPPTPSSSLFMSQDLWRSAPPMWVRLLFSSLAILIRTQILDKNYIGWCTLSQDLVMRKMPKFCFFFFEWRCIKHLLFPLSLVFSSLARLLWAAGIRLSCYFMTDLPLRSSQRGSLALRLLQLPLRWTQLG